MRKVWKFKHFVMSHLSVYMQNNDEKYIIIMKLT